MLDIKYKIIKQYITDHGITSLAQYTQNYLEGKLPSNFPRCIIDYLKRHDAENFISTVDLFPKPIKLSKVKPVKIPKPPKVVVQKYTYDELVKIIRPLGMLIQRDWNIYRKANKAHWDERIPIQPHKYYLNKGWINWQHFLIGDHVPVKMSQGEREIFTILRDENIYFEMNKKFPDLKNNKLSYDFYIPSKNYLIEYDGIYHFNKVKRSNTKFQKIIDNDLMKNKYAFDNNINLRRIAYYEHQYISQILFDCGITSTPDHKLIKKNPYPKPFSGLSKNYKYYATSGLFTYTEVHKIRQLYLSGMTRIPINKTLNLNMSRYTYNDMVANKTYFDSTYDKSKRIVIPKPPKPPKLYKVDPLLMAELRQANLKRKNLKDNEFLAIENKINFHKKELDFYKKKFNIRPNQSMVQTVVKEYVVPKPIDKDNFSKFGTYKHYGRYTYENFEFKGKDVKGEITCKLHGAFFQTPHNHLSVNKGSQCPKCAIQNKDNPLPWRDVREIKEFEKRKKNITEINSTIINDLKTTIYNIEFKINQLKADQQELFVEIDKEINRLKGLIYPTYISKTKIKPIKSIKTPYLVNNGVSSVRKLSYQDYKYIIENTSMGSKKLGHRFSIDPSTIKKIRRKETYKPYAAQYAKEKNSQQ